MEPYNEPNGKGVYEIRWMDNTIIVGGGEGDLSLFDLRNFGKPILQFYPEKDRKLQLDEYSKQDICTKRYDLNLRKNGAIRGIFCDNRKIVSGSASGIVTVSDIRNGNYVAKYTSLQLEGDAKNYMMCLSQFDNRFMCAVTANRKLAIFDFTAQQAKPVPLVSSASPSPSFHSSLSQSTIGNNNNNSCSVQ